MSEPPVESPTTSQQRQQDRQAEGEEEIKREECEGEEKILQEVLEVLADSTTQESREEGEVAQPGATGPVEKEKFARVQSVFSLVRNQIRAQAGLERQKSGILNVVQQITRELERNRGEVRRSPQSQEGTGSEEGGGKQEPREVSDGEGVLEKEEDEDEGEEKEEERRETDSCVCVVLLEEVLESVESLRSEMREELAQLRLEMQGYTERALWGMETRLMHSLRAQTIAHKVGYTAATHQRQHAVEKTDQKKQKPPTIPALGLPKRRTLTRTMTTLTPKTCPPLGLGPRSKSEPLAGGDLDTPSSSCSGSAHMLLRGVEHSSQSLGPLPPTHPQIQLSKKVLRSRTRMARPAP